MAGDRATALRISSGATTISSRSRGRYLLDPDSPNSAHRFDEWKRAFAPDGPSFQTLRNRFGSWTEVKRRALAQGDVAE